MKAIAALLTGGTLALGLTALASPALAHHSFASFDLTRVVRVDGVVAEFQWTNPHAWAELDVTRPDGEVERWGIEFNSPNNLSREGWKRDMLKPGDQVTFYIHPMRDGQKGGFYYEVVLADGQTVTVGMTPFQPPEGFTTADAERVYQTP